VQLGSFGGDFEELAALVEREWSAHYGAQARFAYPAQWLAGFLDGGDAELAIEARDDSGALAGFICGVPRLVRAGARDLRLGLCTLHTAGRASGFLGVWLLRELLVRARKRGLDGTTHFCVDGHRTAELCQRVAAADRHPLVELEPVQSWMTPARRSPAPPDEVRPLDDAAPALAFVEQAARGLPLARRFAAGELRDALGLYRGERLIGVARAQRRRILGATPTEVANLDFAIAPEATPEEAARFVAGIAHRAALDGAQLIIGPRRPASLFPHARTAGLRLGGRTLRTLVSPSAPLGIEPGAQHLLEVE
jgi:hypothetical protein